jgi:Family of unknown function (DUF6152)
MNRRHHPWPTLVLMSVLGLGISVTTWAHHSFAMFDKTKVVKVHGLISKVEWRNPHVYLYLQVKDTKGIATEYAVECASVNDLSRHGWKMSTVKAGDQVTLGIYPLRDGKPGGLLDSVTLANGTFIKE